MNRIIIIKLGALGDVVRTTPILEAIKEKYPDSEITWITKPESQEILEENQFINKILTIPIEIEQQFDILYNFDLDYEATSLASQVKADKKYGYYDNEGFPASFNSSAEYYINTVFDDNLKKTNRKTYQEMMFEIAELEYKKQPCILNLTERDIKYAGDFIKSSKIAGKKLIGIHMGSSSRWPSKAWSEEKIEEFIIKAKNKGYEILLFGGPNERESHAKLISKLISKNIIVFQNDLNNSIKQFASLVNICSYIVCGDTLALHISLALKKPTIALFFCTSPYEIEGYGLLKKIISPNIKDFFPEKSDQYNKALVNSISADEVLKAIESTKQ